MLESSAIRKATSHRSPPKYSIGAFGWVRANLFNSVFNSIMTLLAGWAIFVTVPKFIRWAFLDCVWYTKDPTVCHEAAGACWAVIAEKHRVMLFGTFPFEEHWRAVLAIAIIIGLAIISAFQRFWSYKLFGAWLVGIILVLILMLGGIFGLKPTGTHEWGGLPLTLMLFVGTIVGGLPMAVMLALGRRSNLPAIKAICIGVIEITRGLPLLTILFMAAIMFPLFVPEGITIDKVLRAQIAMMIFFAAYGAEIVRGGLQAIPIGQYEAADAIGLTYWQKTRRIILPQAIRIVIPAMMNDIIRAFKNTTFISIIGLFDILGATATSLEDPLWVRYPLEAYIFIFMLYFCFCYTMSKYSQWMEKHLNTGRSFR